MLIVFWVIAGLVLFNTVRGIRAYNIFTKNVCECKQKITELNNTASCLVDVVNNVYMNQHNNR